MTLCLAWRNAEGVINLASDSRITLPDKYSDYGLKIFSVPIKVYYPTNRGFFDADVAFERNYGLAFAGSFLGVQLLREYLFNVLQNLQCVPGYIEISFEAICRIVNHFFCYLVKKTFTELDDELAIDFFFTGYCPKQNCFKIAKFAVDYNNDISSFTPSFKIFPVAAFVDCVGCGGDSFLALLQGKHLPDKQLIKLFCSAIKHPQKTSIGGNPQFGSFDKQNNFRTQGVIISSENKTSAGCYLSGIDMNGEEFGPKCDELFFMGNYIDLLSE